MNNAEVLMCPEVTCSKQYPSRGNLNRHIRSSHPQLYDNMIRDKTVHPRATITNVLSEASSVNTINHGNTTPEATVSRTFRCSHEDCQAELSSYEGWIRHRTEIHGKKQHRCNMEDCTLTFARKEQLRSHVNRFHGVIVAPLEEVWSSEMHMQSYLYGPRRKSLKLQSYSDESNHSYSKQACTQIPSQLCGLTPLQQSITRDSQQHATTIDEQLQIHVDSCNKIHGEVFSSDNHTLSTQNVQLESLSQISLLYSDNVTSNQCVTGILSRDMQ